jgi:hypothetical protein
MFGQTYQGKASYDKVLVDNAFKGKTCNANIAKEMHDITVRHVRSRLVMVRHVRIMHIRTMRVRVMHVMVCNVSVMYKMV